MMQLNPMRYQQFQTTQDLCPKFLGVGVQPQIQPHGHGTMNGMDVHTTTGQILLKAAPLEKPWADHYPIYCQVKEELVYADHASIRQEEHSEERYPYRCSLCQRKSASLKGLKLHLYRHHNELSVGEHRGMILRALGGWLMA